jgi:hypothetical protein
MCHQCNKYCWDHQKQTQMAQEHAEFILELKQNTENKTHKDFPVQKVPKNYQQEGHLAFQNEENKIS